MNQEQRHKGRVETKKLPGIWVYKDVNAHKNNPATHHRKIWITRELSSSFTIVQIHPTTPFRLGQHFQDMFDKHLCELCYISTRAKPPRVFNGILKDATTI